jgi:hypothetical protein
LTISFSGCWLRPPRAERVILSRQGALFLLTKKLVEHRLEKPGQALPVEALIRSGWPKEKMRPESGYDRLYTSISRLRRLGLDQILIRQRNGYLLDPRIRVVVAEEEP